MAVGNPFSPTFGVPPPVLAGRDAILEDIGDALATGPSHPDFTSLLIGARGTGKTVMLGEIAEMARRRGWLVLSDNASPSGLSARLERGAVNLLRSLENGTPARWVSSVRVGGFGMDFELPPAGGADHDLRGVLTVLGDRLADNGAGLLITLDELQSGDLEEIREFGSVIQLAARVEPRPVAFLGAAIPAIEETLLAGAEATFLQRCARHDIGRLDRPATRTALVQPIRMRGASVDSDAVSRTVEATSGYPFMVQLVGFHAWKAADDPHSGITAQEVRTGIREAERRLGRLVLGPTWKNLSDTDRRFLSAMARDNGPSLLSDIARRLGVGVNYTSVYRRRLINAGMITPAGRGRVEFTHTATRQWLHSDPSYSDPADSADSDPSYPADSDPAL